MWVLLQASGAHADAARDLPGGYGASLLQSLLALAAVCILAWVVLRWSASRGLGTGAGRRMKVIERVPLDARRWVYLVEIGERVLVVGAGDNASPTLLAELKKSELPDAPEARSFLEVLRSKDSPTKNTPAEDTPAKDAQRGVEPAPERDETRDGA